MEADRAILEHIRTNILYKTEQIIKETIEKNKLVCSIYEAINPHPFYREIRLQQRRDGIEVMCEGQGERFFLDYILSSAQSNVLALSIFLGFALQQRWSELEQILIDDPIQNMDDINILSLIDIIRGLYLDSTFSKQLIISTHDNKVAELFRRKFRNLEIDIVRFETYTSEGPRVIHYDKLLQVK
jgi:DNA repair exonuclease SbcCD ATPase subunit